MNHKGMSWHNVGALLAILAGLYLFAFDVWGGHLLQMQSSTVQTLLSLLVGIGFLVAAYLSDSRPAMARAILWLGSILLVLSTILSAFVFGQFEGLLVSTLSLIPVVLGVVSALTIGPLETNASP